MSIVTTRAQRRQLARESAKQPAALREVPRHEWPIEQRTRGPQRVWRSRDFLVQEYAETDPVLVRLSVLRTTIDPKAGRWADGITWDVLQRLKREAGYGDADAVEVFPRDSDVVNVANMRHLWVMAGPLGFAWRNRP